MTDGDRMEMWKAASRYGTAEREPMPGQVWKLGDEFLPFHPQASHVPPDYRDGWNRCYFMAIKRAAALAEGETP